MSKGSIFEYLMCHFKTNVMDPFYLVQQDDKGSISKSISSENGQQKSHFITYSYVHVLMFNFVFTIRDMKY